eukprot:UN04227
MIIFKKLDVLKIKIPSHINDSYTIKYLLLLLVSSFLKIMNVNVYETCKLLFVGGIDVAFHDVKVNLATTLPSIT